MYEKRVTLKKKGYWLLIFGKLYYFGKSKFYKSKFTKKCMFERKPSIFFAKNTLRLF